MVGMTNGRPIVRPHIVAPALILATGGFITFVHDYAYRRVGGADYEIGGLISHAGSDMVVVTIASALVTSLYLFLGRNR